MLHLLWLVTRILIRVINLGSRFIYSSFLSYPILQLFFCLFVFPNYKKITWEHQTFSREWKLYIVYSVSRNDFYAMNYNIQNVLVLMINSFPLGTCRTLSKFCWGNVSDPQNPDCSYLHQRPANALHTVHLISTQYCPA